MRCCSHSVHWNPAIRNYPVVDGVIIDHGRVAIHPRDLCRSQMPMAEVPMGEVFEGDKSKAVRPQAEIEIQSHAHAIESPAKADVEYRVRRYRRPTAVIS